MIRKLATRSVFILSAFALMETSPLPIMVQDASAQNLLQAIFGGGQRKKRQEAERRRQEELARQEALKKKPPRIKGPSYKTYRADKLVVAKLATLTDPVTTGAVQPENTESDATQAPTVIAEPTPFALGYDALASLKLKVLPEVADALVATYSKSPKYRWVSNKGLNDQAKAIMKVLADAEYIGLPAENYQVEMPVASLETGETNWQDLMRFEMEFSAAILSYVVDSQRGLIDPNRISGYHDFKRKTPELSNVIVRMAYSADPAATLAFYSPQGDHFNTLESEMVELLGADEKERITIADGTFLKPGTKNPELRNIIMAIRVKGSEQLKTDMAFQLNTYLGNDEYTPQLVELVKAFQKENNLAADGIVGKKTIRALVEDSNEVKINKLRYAMERARWLPSKFAAKHVFINAPAYKVTYFENHKPELEMRVVVGKRANQTNFFSDEIEKVEFNPYWGVPQSIITNEMLPKLRADPSYLDRLGYQVSYNGRSTSSSSISWSSLSSTRSIGVRQPPGPKNALGQLKILFPNKHAIYMHDTPAKKLFGRDTRAFSHGCVRLHDPQAMAAAVLGTTVDEIENHIAPRKNKTVFVEKTIPVHVAYFTAWPNAETGEIEYFEDVYGRDKALEKAYNTTIKSRVGA
ncbi:MAG: L,D-transpeptidase family protein [Lentilitoribacter sp.]